MIDFRYHLVSIVAVFLALAIGIVLGTSTFRGPVIQQVKGVAQTLTKENEQLRSEVTSLRQQVDADQHLIRDFAPGLVAGMLESERVVVVETPGASGELRDQVASLLEQAGAESVTRVSVQWKYLEDGEAGVLGELASRLKPAGMELAEGSPYERSAAALAEAIMAGGAGGAAGASSSDDTQTSTVLSGFETGGYLKTSGDPKGAATLAVMIAPAEPFEEGAARDNHALTAFAHALDERGGGAVIAGSAREGRQGAMIPAFRGSDEADTVSTVDFADTATGRVVTVLALAGEDMGKTGHYGVGPGAGAYLPAISPDSAESEGR